MRRISITRISVGLILSASFFAANVFAQDSREPVRIASVPLPQINTPEGEKCVEPTDVMRRNHMAFILHQRDDTLRRGVRTKKYSLKECINCHADPKTKSVVGKDGFCESCHVYSAVSIDCFGCHNPSTEKTGSTDSTVPRGTGAYSGAFMSRLGHNPPLFIKHEQ